MWTPLKLEWSHVAEVELGFSVALLGGLAIPLHRPGVVLGDASAGVIHEAESAMGSSVALLGKRTQLANGRRMGASMIGCHTLIQASPSRCRQAQREPGAQRRDKREVGRLRHA